MPGRPRDPKKEKRIALERDRVDQWGESQKAARKKLPKKKALISRAYRKAVSQSLRTAADPDEVAVRRKEFRKWKGPTLGEAIRENTDRRERLQKSPRKSEAARRRRKERRSRAKGE